MSLVPKREYAVLLLGDVVVFTASLWFALALRFLTPPSSDFFYLHFFPFTILFAVWAVVLFLAGLCLNALVVSAEVVKDVAPDGTLTFESGGQLAFDDCAFAKGFVLVGNGEADYGADRFKMGVLVAGLADGELTYERDGDSVSVTGFYDGQAIELTK